MPTNSVKHLWVSGKALYIHNVLLLLYNFLLWVDRMSCDCGSLLIALLHHGQGGHRTLLSLMQITVNLSTHPCLPRLNPWALHPLAFKRLGDVCSQVPPCPKALCHRSCVCLQLWVELPALVFLYLPVLSSQLYHGLSVRALSLSVLCKYRGMRSNPRAGCGYKDAIWPLSHKAEVRPLSVKAQAG